MASQINGDRLTFAMNGTLSIGDPTAMAAHTTQGAGTILIGGHRGLSTTYPAAGRGTYAEAIYKRDVTNDEPTTIYIRLRTYGAGRRITTV